MTYRLGISLSLTAVIFCLATTSYASTILGTGTGALVGGDLTDPENDGTAGGANYNADFFASDEPSFGGGENAFNVFSNTLGTGNNKWCCGTSFPQIVGAMNFDGVGTKYVLDRFTLSSSNDSPQRDPQVWRIEGSNDTTTGLDGTWTTIFDHPVASNDWTGRNQVISYSESVADGDVFLTNDGFTAFRMVTDATGATSGAFFALGEIEFFGQEFVAVPEPASIAIWSLIGLGLVGFGWYRTRRKK